MPNHRDMANQPVMKRDRLANGMNPPRTGQGDLSHLTAPIQPDHRATGSLQVTNENHLESVMNPPLNDHGLQNRPIAIGLKKELKAEIDHLEEIVQGLLATAVSSILATKDRAVFQKVHIQKAKMGTNHLINVERALIPVSQSTFRKIQLAGLSKRSLGHLVQIQGLENFQNHLIAIGLRKVKTSHLVKVGSSLIQNLKSAKVLMRSLTAEAVALLKRETHHRKSFRGTWW